MEKVTLKRLVECLAYNPDTGVFTWNISTGRRKTAGSIAGSKSIDRYTKIMIDKKTYKAHRLAWFYSFGVWPDGEIDHIDGNGNNNSIENLRVATSSQNKQNLKQGRADSSTGLLGVKAKKTGRFEASIMRNGVSKHLGTYTTAIEAHSAYISAKRSIHEFCTI